MSTETASDGSGWVPQACTLPTPEQPLRVAEFDELFAIAVRRSDRSAPGRLSMELVSDDQVAARAASLAVRETGCCSFFTFALTATQGRLLLQVSVPDAHADVLDALADHIGAGRRQ